MIECFTMATAHRYGDALASQFRLRHRVFIDRTAYDVPRWQGMEFDQYDTPATTFLVWRDAAEKVRGVARLTPTTLPYMLKDAWPDMVTAMTLPSCPTIWEGTRFGIDRDLSHAQRRQIASELVVAYAEVAIAAGIRGIIGVMPTLIVRSLFSSNGWPVEVLGPPRKLGKDKCIAGLLPVSEEILHRVREKTGLIYPIVFKETPIDNIDNYKSMKFGKNL